MHASRLDCAKLAPSTHTLFVAMNRGGRERREADGDVVRAVLSRRAVTYPLAGKGDHCLPGANVDGPALVLHAKHAPQHDGDFFEVRALSWLFPAAWRNHAGHAHGGMLGVHAARKFLNLLRLVAGAVDDGGLLDQTGHFEHAGTEAPAKYSRNGS